MRPKPIFDTNIFGHVQDGSISGADWRFLLRHRPGHGWPLSIVTAVELLVGLDGASPQRFAHAKEQIGLAYRLSRGRVLEDPNFLFCKEVLRAPFPAKLARPRPELIADYMQVACCAKSLEDIRGRRVQVRGLRTRGGGQEGFAGFDPAVVAELLAGPKREWVDRSEMFADEVYSPWREHLEKTGKRVPDEMRAALKARRIWDAEKAKLCEAKLLWLEANAAPESVREISRRLEAEIDFSIFVYREMLLGNYKPEKHASDVYDQFQLHYLAMDRFILVSEDRALATRTASSAQADRILSFEAFLKGL